MTDAEREIVQALVDALEIAARPCVEKLANEQTYDTDLERMVPEFPDMASRLRIVDTALGQAEELIPSRDPKRKLGA